MQNALMGHIRSGINIGISDSYIYSWVHHPVKICLHAVGACSIRLIGAVLRQCARSCSGTVDR